VNAEIPRAHPYWHVRAVIEQREDVVAVPASYYAYTPRTVADARTTFLIPVEDFLTPHRMHHYISETPAGQEMAIHSNVRMSDNQTLHLVMVDMSTGARAHLEKLRAFIGDNYADKIAWYRSGRSFHGYGDTLLTGELWVRFMGLLLLANQPSLEPTVDPRWIGHRLLAGYAALRWTKNTEHYLSAPSSIASIGSHRSSSVEVGAVGKKLSAQKPGR
jgi:hypothetical protein